MDPSARPAFLSVIQWPDKMTEDEAVEALVASAAIEPYQAAMAVRRGVPQVVSRIDALVIPDVMQELRRRKVMAFCPRADEIEAVQSPRLLKRLELRGSSLHCEYWRHEDQTLAIADIKVIVFALSRRSLHSSTEPDPTGSTVSPFLRVHPHQYQYDLASTIFSGLSRSPATVHVSHIIDMYDASGNRYRSNGDKFNYDILGANRGHSDMKNSRRLAKLLHRLAPHAIYDDQGFNNFKCPAHILQRVMSRTSRNERVRMNTLGALDFYSAWTFLLYKKLMGF